jgi:tetratricopeptide (TPR) repeat protein
VQVFKGHKAAFLKDYVSSLRFYETALVSYEEALNSTPNDPSLLRSYAKVYLEIEKAVMARDNLQKRRLKDSPYLTRADLFYRLSIAANKEDTVPLAEYACFLEFVREYDAAEQHYLQALTIDPNDAYCLRKYALFLQEVRQNIGLAERFLVRSQQTSRVLEIISQGGTLTPELEKNVGANNNNSAVQVRLPMGEVRTRGRSRSEDATGAEQQETRLRSFSHKDLRNTTPLKQAVTAVSVPLQIDASNERVPVMIINDKTAKK